MCNFEKYPSVEIGIIKKIWRPPLNHIGYSCGKSWDLSGLLKKIDIFLLVFALFLPAFLRGCEGAGKTARLIKPPKSGAIYFSKADPIGDDNGPGNYEYPTNPAFKPGSMDLIRFTVMDAGDFVNLIFDFHEEIVKVESYDGGWAQPMIDIYINEGKDIYPDRKNALPGRNFKFGKRGWNKAIIVSPLRREIMEGEIEKKTEILSLLDMFRKGELLLPQAVMVGPNTLVARMLKSELGTPNDNWRWQVAVMGFDGTDRHPDRFFNMVVSSVARHNNFGGGSEFDGNPNIIDMLEPEGESQKSALSRWYSNPDPSQNELAIIDFAASY